MSLHQNSTTLITLLLTLLLSSNFCFAGPSVKLCVDENCRKAYRVNISDMCWSNITALFSTPPTSDKAEQDNIVKALALLKHDTYYELVKKVTFTDEAEDLYANSSNKNNYRNIKNYLGVLLDNYLVKHHMIRKTISQTRWGSFELNGLLLQSLTDSSLYILETNTSDLRAVPQIKSYNKPSDTNPEDSFEKDSYTLNNEDFE